MNPKLEKFTTGVIVARFQVPELHEAHLDLINSVLKNHHKLLIFLGLAPTKGTINNPLDYQPRRQMLLQAFPPDKYPNISIGYINDTVDDKVWSEKLDKLIQEQIQVNDTVLLYGSRDSFLGAYKGKFTTRELESERRISGSEIRAQVAAIPQNNAAFRAGAIWATHQRHKTVYPTVDIAIVDRKENKILLARKPHEKLYRFVGGFVDAAKDNSLEDAAIREVIEETGLTLKQVAYIGSTKVDDWRYRNEVDKIVTSLFVGYYIHGIAQANDDIAEVRWIDFDKINSDLFVLEHRNLLDMLYEKKILPTEEMGS